MTDAQEFKLLLQELGVSHRILEKATQGMVPRSTWQRILAGKTARLKPIQHLYYLNLLEAMRYVSAFGKGNLPVADALLNALNKLRGTI